jgi:hypothetical protein
VGFNTLVLEESAALEPHCAEWLRCSLTAAQSLLAIVSQLLEYTKFEHAQRHGGVGVELADGPLRMRDVLDELVDVTGGKAAAAGVALCVEVDARLQAASLRGDAARFRQVLVNLTGACCIRCIQLLARTDAAVAPAAPRCRQRAQVHGRRPRAGHGRRHPAALLPLVVGPAGQR